ncbi:MAG: PucR family transcriptional regulator [Eubacterium sp.]|nr:PucR family transcriptional regulator [Eubacterium sp.]
MIINLNMLLTQLQKQYPELSLKQYLDISSPHIAGIRLLPYQQEEISPDYLYLCEPNHPIHQKRCPEQLLLICLCQPEQIPDSCSRILWIETKTEPAVIFNSLQEIYILFQNWDRSMHDNLIQNLGFSHLIQISEPFLNNPLLIFDLSMKLLAHSKSNVAADKIFPNVVEQGSLTSEMVTIFQQEKIFDILNEKGIYVSETEKDNRHREIIKLFYIDGKPAGYCVLVLVKAFELSYTRAIFENFFESAQISLEKMMHGMKTERFMYEYLLIDLLENELPDPFVVKDRLKYINLPYTSVFYLFLLELHASGSITIPFLLHSFQQLLPEAHIFEYQERIVILIFNQKKPELMNYTEQFPHLYRGLLHEIRKYEICCGIGRPFFEIVDIKSAYREAQAAICSAKKYGKSPASFFFFEDLSLNILCDLDESADGYRITKHTKAEQIFADDTANQTNYAQILYTYLTTGCQATETARLLHMHRNNVLYHIRRMETKYHLHLDQFEERLKLTLAMYAKKRV